MMDLCSHLSLLYEQLNTVIGEVGECVMYWIVKWWQRR